MMNRVEMMNEVKVNRQQFELNDFELEEVVGGRGLWTKMKATGSVLAKVIKELF